MKKYFSKMAERLGLSWQDLLALGQEKPGDQMFSMTVLALKMSSHCNGVSKLHGCVSRDMWKDLWPGLPKNEIPIGHITNGIHTLSWISHDLEELMVRYIGP